MRPTLVNKEHRVEVVPRAAFLADVLGATCEAEPYVEPRPATPYSRHRHEAVESRR